MAVHRQFMLVQRLSAPCRINRFHEARTGDPEMIKKFAAFGLCAAIALSPMAALAQAAAPDATAPAADAAKPMAEKPMKSSHKMHKSTSHKHKKMKKPMEDKTMTPAPA